MRLVYKYLLILLLCTGGRHALGQQIYVQQTGAAEAFNAPIRLGAVSGVSNLLAVSTDKNLKLYNVLTFDVQASLPQFVSSVACLEFSANGQSLITGTSNGLVQIWNASTGALVKTIPGGSSAILSLVVAGQSLIVTAGLDRSLNLIDALSGKTVNSISRLQDDIRGLTIHPTGKMVAVGLAGGEIRLLLLPGLELLQTLTDPGLKISSLSFTVDGAYLAAGGLDGIVRLWGVGTWTLQGKLNTQARSLTAVAIDPTNAWIVTTSFDSTLKIFDFNSLALRKTVREPKESFSFLAFSDRETLCAATTGGRIVRWRVLASPPDTLPPVIAIQEPPVDSGEPMKIYGKEYIVRGVVSDQSNIKEVTLNGSPVAIQGADTTDSVKQTTDRQRRQFRATVPLPSVGTNAIELKATDEFGNVARHSFLVERLSADQAIEVLSPETNAETDKISTQIQFRAWFEATSFEVLVNLLQMAESKSIAKLKPGELVSEDIPLVVGYNQIQIIVTSKSGERVSKTLGVTRKVLTPLPSTTANSLPPERGIGPQRWAVIVGISEYANPNVTGLKFADRDADALASFLQKPEGGGFDQDHVRLLLNKDATLENLREALINFLSHAIDKDLVIIYFAGHGLPDPARPSNLYLLTYDTDPSILGTSAFPMWQIQDVLARYISAKRIVVFSDACHSGGMSVGFATRGMGLTESNPINQYLADLARSKEGIVVFTASAAGEVSQELPELNHGVFTYYLLKGMQGDADLDNDYTVTINELMQYVEEQVKRKTKGAQNPTRSQTSYDKDLPISLIPH